MEIFDKITPLKAFLATKKREGKSIGLVPTMGALHKGHLTLLEVSKQENTLTVCSIYVNPAQFNNQDDLTNYPRNLEKDIHLLKEVGCDVLFCPDNSEMYDASSIISFDFGSLGTVMEGMHRPGHFSGVALVVAKLFNITNPDKAYFGQKDWQQFAIIRQLVEELKFPLTLRGVPTVREADGLAMSSRNQRLSSAQRKHASVFYHILLQAKEALINNVVMEEIKNQATNSIAPYPDIKLEYLELADRVNLTPFNSVGGNNPLILCIAGYVGTIRLIDNMFVDLPTKKEAS